MNSTADAKAQSRRAAAILWVGFLTALVVIPWLSPGYIFGTDFAGPRFYPFPTTAASYAGLQLTLALAGSVLPGDAVGKVLITIILFTAGMTAYVAVPAGGFVPRAVASVVYLLNPFVYDRLAYGQLNVLGGYAVLPWVVSSTRWLLLEPTWKRALRVACAAVILGILDLHLTLAALLFGAALGLTHVAAKRKDRHYLARLSWNAALAFAITLAASAYWMVPILTRSGSEASRIAQMGAGDLTAFSTVADHRLGLLPNVLGLYGFWGEGTNRFASMKVFVPAWALALALLMFLAAVGAMAAWRSVSATYFQAPRPWLIGLLGAGLIATVLEMGVAEPHVAPVVRLLDADFPVYRGLRDAGKWAAVLAIVYSQLIPIGVLALMDWTKSRSVFAPLREIGPALLVAVVLAVPLYYGNGLLFGLHDQVRPSFYPSGWYALDRTLAADPDPGRSVFLPWHGYLSFSFVRNANNVVASPAPQFFSVPVVASQDPEIPGVFQPRDQDQALLTQLVAEGGTGNWARTLAEHNFKYVLLAREATWQSYEYLGAQASITLVADYGSILLYRNMLWTGNVLPP